MTFYHATPLHDGEVEMRKVLHSPDLENHTVPTLSPQLANHLKIAPLISIGTIDSAGRPWTTLWGNGNKGFAQSLGGGIIGIRTPVTGRHDPVIEELVGKDANGQVVREEGAGRMVSGLTIDLETRKRVKMYGRMVAGALGTRDDEATETEEHIAEVQLVIKIEQSLGNCPKYLNQKHIVSGTSNPKLISDSPQLPQRALDLIEKTDLLFMSTSQHTEDMDTNHRGGPPGFIRVVSNDESGAVLVYPEYSGNRLYQSLGNLAVNPVAGICIPDFETGDMLYLTGKTEVLIGQDAAALLPRSNLAVKITTTAARFVTTALPFRGIEGERSPYNPQVRYLPSEKPPAQSGDSRELQQATLLSQTPLTPTISRFKFALPSAAVYSAGQYVTLDMSSHLDMGYSHMRDDDPRSLNDDFLRTFTVSSAPPSCSSSLAPNEFEITIRKVGVATDFLFKHDGTQDARRAGLDVAVRGFGGDFTVADPDDPAAVAFFVAAGAGITPLLPSLDTLDFARLRVAWSLRVADIPLARDMLLQHPALASSLTVFVTDAKPSGNESNSEEEAVQSLRKLGATVHLRRMEKADLVGLAAESGAALKVEAFYLCTAGPMRKKLLEWLKGEKVIFEDFDF